MRIAKELKDNSICEYLLYMWQVEDTLRAFQLDIERLASDYVSRFPAEEQMAELQWMEDLIAMMREEGKQEFGHLQMNESTLMLLTDLHNELLHSPKHPFYSAAYYKALPFIVELRAHNHYESIEVPELETCLEALYGVMLLRLQKKEVSTETQTAMQHISHLLALLSDAYKKDKAGELEL